MPNRLARETSPYLLQHADNPVNWYPWCEEALHKAKTEEKPIFLSIGYSACHWCHVMAHESFEDEGVAAILNEHFVSIKVDREERPDLDRIYMRALQHLTGMGGWPMSLFLSPNGEPFFGGTYFPPTSRYELPSFKEVLLAVADAWQNRREELVGIGKRMVKTLKELSTLTMKHEKVKSETLITVFHQIWQLFDWTHGGWGEDSKFPQPMVLEFLLRYNYTTKNKDALQMVKKTLKAMAMGGIYDQLGGGFHRYSMDNHWLVPHFEKMLYDNAQLATVYLHAWQVTGEPFYRTIAEETLDYVVREMTSPEGGFYSTQAADSEGEEGKFYLWTAEEIRAVLGEDSEAFIPAYGVSEEGNFEDRNLLKFVGSIDQRERLSHLRQKLFEVRDKRVHPGRDEKILTAWNGLMLSAFAEAARVLGRDDYRQVAQRNADFILSNLRTSERRLLHVWKDDKVKINGYLEDYTHLIFGLLELYQTTFEPRWYVAARELAEIMIEHFSSSDGGFFDVSDDYERMLIRTRALEDNALPSGNAMAVYVLLQLGGLANEPRYTERAHHILGQAHPLLRGYPLQFGQWLIALDYTLSHPREVAIVGQPEAADARALLEECIRGYRPHQVVALGTPETSPIPLLQGHTQINEHATAYVCVDFTCHPPVTDPEALQKILK